MQNSLFETVPEPGKHGFYSERACKERRNRIKIAVAAYSYEIENNPIMSDEQFDSLAKTINLELKTGFKKLDDFFLSEFQPHTGQWIHKHPELNKIAGIYNRLKR